MAMKDDRDDAGDSDGGGQLMVGVTVSEGDGDGDVFLSGCSLRVVSLSGGERLLPQDALEERSGALVTLPASVSGHRLGADGEARV